LREMQKGKKAKKGEKKKSKKNISSERPDEFDLFRTTRSSIFLRSQLNGCAYKKPFWKKKESKEHDTFFLAIR